MRGNGEYFETVNVKDNKLLTNTVEFRDGLVFMKASVKRIISEH